MLKLHDPSGFSTPTLPDIYGDASPAHFGLPDDAQAEIDAREAQLEAQQNESNPFDYPPGPFEGECQCRDCGRTTAGSRIGGGDVMLCDDCLIIYVLNSIDSAKVRELTSEMYPEWFAA